MLMCEGEILDKESFIFKRVLYGIATDELISFSIDNLITMAVYVIIFFIGLLIGGSDK